MCKDVSFACNMNSTVLLEGLILYEMNEKSLLSMSSILGETCINITASVHLEIMKFCTSSITQLQFGHSFFYS